MKFVAIGHVDMGKSCLCGRLLYKSGFVTEHEMGQIRDKAEREGMSKWVWSRVLDIYEEEMQKGKTHEFNEIGFSLNDRGYTLVDTPGHQTFVRSMIAGINRDINVAVLLVSVAENEFIAGFERGMLKEHTILSRAVGIEHLIVTINKMDLVNWSQEIYLDRVDQIKKFLKKLWPMDKVRFIPISAFNGIGLTDLSGMPDWCDRKSFIDLLNEIPIKQKSDKSTEKIKSDLIKAQIKILGLKSIMTKGYDCVAHIQDREYEIEVTDMDKLYGKTGDILKCQIKFRYSVELPTNARIILRKDDTTIGFGKII
jgi:small GTP-binding protein